KRGRPVQPNTAAATSSANPASPIVPPSTANPTGTSSPISGTGAPAVAQQRSAAGASVPRLVVPDVIAAVPGGVTSADLSRLRKLTQVRVVLPIAGARIMVNGKPLTVLGAPAAALRPWTPPATAVSQRVWADFAAGDLITTGTAARSLHLASGSQYPVAATLRTRLTFGTRALLGIAGVDAIVNQARVGQLGLVAN